LIIGTIADTVLVTVIQTLILTIVGTVIITIVGVVVIPTIIVIAIVATPIGVLGAIIGATGIHHSMWLTIKILNITLATLPEVL
jgi:hypothetical protein